MNDIYHWVGFATVWLFLAIVAVTVAYNIYLLVRAVVLAADFTRWYLAQSKLYDPNYKMKHHVMGYMQMIAQMYNYDKTTTRFHKNGAIYKPFAKV